jgi:hypothetical protein
VNHHSSVERAIDDIKTGGVIQLRDKFTGNLFTGWAVSGIEMARSRFGLLCGTAGTCAAMLRETAKKSPFKAQSTEAQRRGGLTRSSDEGSVMDLERRGWIVSVLRHEPTNNGRSS